MDRLIGRVRGRPVGRKGIVVTVVAGLVAGSLLAAPGVAAARPAKGDSVKPATLEWRRTSLSGAGNLNGIATDGKSFVDVGLVSLVPAGPAPIWTSKDGVAWTRARVKGGSFPAKTILIDVVRDDDRFLAFGRPATGAGEGTLAWSSKDGLVWKRYKPKGFPVTATGEPALATTTKDGVALLVGDDATSAYSLWTSRGDTWKSLGPVPAPGAPVATLLALAQVPGRKDLSVGGLGSSQAKAWYSKTGKSWAGTPVPFTSPDKFSEIKALVPFRSGLVALGIVNGPTNSEIPFAWSSEDGRTWTPASGSLPAFMGGNAGGQGMDAGVTNGSGVLGAGHDGGSVAFWSSRDGKRWTRVPDHPGLTVGQVPAVSAVAIARGRVVSLVRIRRFNGQSLDLVDLAVVTGIPK